MLTLGRLAISLAYFALLLVLPQGPLFLIPLALLALAGLTDILDGPIARRTGTVSEFGRVADAYIDRVLASGSFIVFLSLGVVEAWAVLVIVVREFLTGGLRNLADARGKRFKANVFGKSKFFSQMAASAVVILHLAGVAPIAPSRGVVDFAVYAAAVITAVTGIIYLANYRKLAGAE
jgi:CDP-diacylglycerol--glycerol-3-phosphate 3-phosphatidyltransferase